MSDRSDAGSFAYHEAPGALAQWHRAPRAGLLRTAEIGADGARVVIAVEWLGADGTPVHPVRWGRYVASLAAAPVALWVRLDRPPFLEPWRAPATGAELRAAMLAQGIDPGPLLAPLWCHLRGERRPLVVVGFPIPDHVGGPDTYVHWQAVRLPAMPKEHSRTRRVRASRDAIRAFGSRTLHWIPMSENWHPDVLQNRGQLPAPLRAARVVVAGGGALGGPVAEHLVRMGVPNVSVVDPDRLEAGNLVRHPLTLNDLHGSKAKALAKGLNACSPTANVRGFDVALPSFRSDVRQALSEADLLLDLTASDVLLRAVPDLGLRGDARVVSASLGLHAERLYLYADDASAYSPDAFDVWFGPYRAAEHAAAAHLGLPQAAGCWNPVTPVPLNRISVFAGLLVEDLPSLFTDRGRTLEARDWPGRQRTMRR
ncbi:MAG TPA: ThiF family adenylyltransferase, partial [Rubricoccaceae bacterium]